MPMSWQMRLTEDARLSISFSFFASNFKSSMNKTMVDFNTSLSISHFDFSRDFGKGNRTNDKQ